MAIGVLGIASGAIKIGQKLFQGIKNRQEKKIEKRAESLVDARDRLAKVEGIFGGVIPSKEPKVRGGFIRSLINPDQGSLAVSGSANALMEAKAGNVKPLSGAQQQSTGTDPNKINPMLLIGGAAIILLLYITKRGR